MDETAARNPKSIIRNSPKVVFLEPKEDDDGEPIDARERSISKMYRDGVSLRTLQTTFGMVELEIINVLRANGVVRPGPGETEAQFLDRVRHDVKHAAAA